MCFWIVSLIPQWKYNQEQTTRYLEAERKGLLLFRSYRAAEHETFSYDI